MSCAVDHVKTANGVELIAKSMRSIGNKPIDTLVVPGGFLVEDVTRDRALMRWIQEGRSEVQAGVFRVRG